MRMASVRRVTAVGVVALVVGLSACDDPTGPDSGQVTLVFRADGAAVGAASDSGAGSVAASRSIEGANGTLVLESLHAILEEFELEGDAEVEMGPRFLELPLSETSTSSFSELVPVGRYHEVELEFEDVDDADLHEEIRGTFREWPEEANIAVTGTFTPHGGSPSGFVVFLEEEIELEWDLEPPLEIDAAGAGSVVVGVDPTPWFLRDDGSVVDPSPFHCDPEAECPVVDFDDALEGDGEDAFALVAAG